MDAVEKQELVQGVEDIVHALKGAHQRFEEMEERLTEISGKITDDVEAQRETMEWDEDDDETDAWEALDDEESNAGELDESTECISEAGGQIAEALESLGRFLENARKQESKQSED